MKSLKTAIVSAFSTFSVLPTPRVEWNAYSLRNVLAALPLVGVVIGGFLCLFYWIFGLLKLPDVLLATAFAILPVALSGGIHLDGFADSVDALSSRAAPEKKRAILKDPHCGAFAVIGVGCYLLSYFGLCAALPYDWRTVGLLGVTHVLSRAVGALLSLVLPSSSETGMQKAFRESAGGSSLWILLAWTVLALGGAAVLSPLAAAGMLAAGALVFLYVRHTANKQFEGMSGDLAGYGVSLAAIAMLLAIVLAERAVALWF
ncbi:MAG: adenosylcobinamide-GDP ribazoletransferase [Clostridia bacterium]|nr:adenosylcobinamide-GDP ribazoletransferase [Clostridia bacterium]